MAAPTAAQRMEELELDTVTLRWQRALDAADRSLSAADDVLRAATVQSERHHLIDERHATATLLQDVARLEDIRPAPRLAPGPVSPKMLGLAATVRACLFDLDGVLTDSGVLHARAWAEAFDGFLLRVSEQAGWRFIPFDRDADYRSYLDGRPRLEGVHAFLASRGIHLPEGQPGDPADADTAYGLAKRKSDALTHSLSQRGVNAIEGARRYLEVCGFAGLGRGVVSASTRTLPMLQLARLGTLVEERVDADVIRVEHLRSRPAPDLLLEACLRLGVEPAETATFTHSPAGVAAGHAAGLTVIGVGSGERAELLRGFGAEPVVASLESLLDRRLAA